MPRGIDPLFLGIDLGGTNTALGLVGSRGLLASREMPTQWQEGPAPWLERLMALVEDVWAQTGDQRQDVAGAGLASPGTLDREQSLVLVSPNLPNWTGFPLAGELSRLLGMPVVLENDANCYLWGEFVLGAGRDRESMAGFTLGTGVGGGVIIQGELVNGPLKTGGELGHMIVEPNGRLCPCGARGCLEAHASATALTGILQEALARGVDTTLTPESNARDMALAARAGDTFAREVIASAGTALGRAVANMAATLGLDFFVIGGKLAQAWDLMEKAARTELEARLKISDPFRVTLTPGRLMGEAPLTGAAEIARHLFEKRTSGDTAPDIPD